MINLNKTKLKEYIKQKNYKTELNRRNVKIK